MTKHDFAIYQEGVFSACNKLRTAGQAEYAQGDSAFDNFERLAVKLGMTREKVLMVYLEKHLDGIFSWVNGHTSQREPVTGRIEDAIVYLTLLHAMAGENAGLLCGFCRKVESEHFPGSAHAFIPPAAPAVDPGCRVCDLPLSTHQPGMMHEFKP